MSGVWLLLYLVNKSLTGLSNAVCEISKCMYKAKTSNHKALLRAIKYVIDTQGHF